jgi:hypothetical protein
MHNKLAEYVRMRRLVFDTAIPKVPIDEFHLLAFFMNSLNVPEKIKKKKGV